MAKVIKSGSVPEKKLYHRGYPIWAIMKKCYKYFFEIFPKPKKCNLGHFEYNNRNWNYNYNNNYDNRNNYNDNSAKD